MPNEKQDTSGTHIAFDPKTGLVTTTVSHRTYKPKAREEAIAAAKTRN